MEVGYRLITTDSSIILHRMIHFYYLRFIGSSYLIIITGILRITATGATSIIESNLSGGDYECAPDGNPSGRHLSFPLGWAMG